MGEGLTPEIPPEEQSESESLEPRILESVTSGGQYYVKGILCREENDQIVQVVDFILVEETDESMIAEYKRLDRGMGGITKPKRFADPKITFRNAQGQVKTKIRGLPSNVCNSKNKIQEGEDFYELSHFELRGHDYQLGETISFGKRKIGRLAVIYPGEKPKVGIIAQETHGKPGPWNVWLADVENVDYLVYEGGAIKTEADGYTIYKPTLRGEQSPEH